MADLPCGQPELWKCPKSRSERVECASNVRLACRVISVSAELIVDAKTANVLQIL